MVISKPAGIATQAPSPHPSLELVVRQHLAEELLPSGYLAFPHRLDRPVSGAILVALTKRAANLLGQQFEAHKVQKRYLAWVQGDATKCPQRWQDTIRKLPHEARCEITHPDAPDGKVAVTDVRVIDTAGATDPQHRPQTTLLELSPLTGRMHQLRLQCAHRGLPICGDSLYGSNAVFPPLTVIHPDARDTPDGATGDNPTTIADATPKPSSAIALHAWSIAFHEPTRGRHIVVQADPPWPDTWLPSRVPEV